MTIKCYGEKQSREKELGMLSEGILVWLRKVWEGKGQRRWGIDAQDM